MSDLQSNNAIVQAFVSTPRQDPTAAEQIVPGSMVYVDPASNTVVFSYPIQSKLGVYL